MQKEGKPYYFTNHNSSVRSVSFNPKVNKNNSSLKIIQFFFYSCRIAIYSLLALVMAPLTSTQL